jgi:hypothetical protein
MSKVSDGMSQLVGTNTLRGEVVDLVGPRLVERDLEGRGVPDIAVEQLHLAEQWLEPRDVARFAAHEPVDLIAHAHEVLGEVVPVLTRDARDQRSLHLAVLSSG